MHAKNKNDKNIAGEIVSFFRFSFGTIITGQFAVVIIPLLLLWEVVPRLHLFSRNLFPTFSDCASAFEHLLLHSNLMGHIGLSVFFFLIGLILSVITAVPTGILLGWNPALRKYFMPVFQILAPIPPTAWVPIALIFLGVGFPLRVFLVYLSSFFPIFLNTFQAIKDTDRRYVLSARVFGASELNILIHVHFYHALGAILMSIRTGISIGLIMLTAAEMYGVNGGLGFLLVHSKEFFRIPDMVVCMAVLGFIGWFLTEIIKYLEKRICLWKESRQEA